MQPTFFFIEIVPQLSCVQPILVYPEYLDVIFWKRYSLVIAFLERAVEGGFEEFGISTQYFLIQVERVGIGSNICGDWVCIKIADMILARACVIVTRLGVPRYNILLS